MPAIEKEQWGALGFVGDIDATLIKAVIKVESDFNPRADLLPGSNPLPSDSVLAIWKPAGLR